MTSRVSHNITYSTTKYKAAAGLSLGDFDIIEDWEGRPASLWSVQRIGNLQSQIEKYTYGIRQQRQGRKGLECIGLSRLIPKHLLITFANKSFGYDGWVLDLISVTVKEAIEHSEKIGDKATEREETMYTVVANAEVRVTLKDGTNTTARATERCTLSSKGECFSRVKKMAANSAFKNAILNFENIVLDHAIKVEGKYYTDNLYKPQIKKEELGLQNTIS
ncbi:hypothetical protein TBLA_0I02910 [Henningerozyma blattae CBS 6284]|uniref:DNA repair protein RAD59 n=1 Tax=Henningerozyma blattae (strain ATCC 34711 / CBS 6284 / DSM 70876 / NBRC 10599 / NRRL Y-10934 / UCD 77-7) TaxID=1071380 RepID=I2H995_HENB6|nr:hypothetical protein TBLA_0I02910 [Tetrapisispora blattae CBS 6284]CCH62947.1 hypothetical protein TBLA_0I02910 [Tetrapisispora blattae CBS 6284]